MAVRQAEIDRGQAGFDRDIAVLRDEAASRDKNRVPAPFAVGETIAAVRATRHFSARGLRSRPGILGA